MEIKSEVYSNSLGCSSWTKPTSSVKSLLRWEAYALEPGPEMLSYQSQVRRRVITRTTYDNYSKSSCQITLMWTTNTIRQNGRSFTACRATLQSNSRVDSFSTRLSMTYLASKRTFQSAPSWMFGSKGEMIWKIC